MPRSLRLQTCQLTCKQKNFVYHEHKIWGFFNLKKWRHHWSAGKTRVFEVMQIPSTMDRTFSSSPQKNKDSIGCVACLPRPVDPRRTWRGLSREVVPIFVVEKEWLLLTERVCGQKSSSPSLGRWQRGSEFPENWGLHTSHHSVCDCSADVRNRLLAGAEETAALSRQGKWKLTCEAWTAGRPADQNKRSLLK